MKHVRFGVLTAVLVISANMLSTIDLNKNFVFAQNASHITSASQLFANIVNKLQQNALPSVDSDEQVIPINGSIIKLE
jgi:Tfp pilus assembly protein PilV